MRWKKIRFDPCVTWINDDQNYSCDKYPSDSEMLERKKINQENERQYKLSRIGLKVLREVLGYS